MNDSMTYRSVDPVGALAEVLSAIDAETRHQRRRLHDNEHNRIGLLVVHAIVALLVPPFFVFTSFTGPTWEVIRQLPGFPYTWISPLWIGGMILLPATFARRHVHEMVGLCFIYLWYMAMALGFSVPVLSHFYRLVRGENGAPAPSLYAPLVYIHLAIIMRVHIATLWRLRRNRARNQQSLVRSQAGLL